MPNKHMLFAAEAAGFLTYTSSRASAGVIESLLAALNRLWLGVLHLTGIGDLLKPAAQIFKRLRDGLRRQSYWKHTAWKNRTKLLV